MIFENERQTVDNKFRAEQTMVYHQLHSAPLVEEIRAILKAEHEARRWLPAEPVGRALTYGLRYLETCTMFLRIPGCPLSTNDAERSIIPVVRHRQASLAYQTQTGALVGDISMTIAGSARLVDKNPIDYMTCCLEFADDIAMDPTRWFPWNYEVRYAELKAQRIAARESQVGDGYRLVHRQLRDASEPESLVAAVPEPQTRAERRSALQN